MFTRKARGGGPARFGTLLLLGLSAAALGACAVRTRGMERYPELAAFAGREIDEVRFVGTAPFSEDTLEQLIETQASRCNLLGLPICIPGTSIGEEVHRLDLEALREDVGILALFYRRSGYFGTRVRPAVEPVDSDVVVTFEIDRGPPVYLEALTVTGTEGILDPDSLERTFPLQPGDPFALGEFTAAADTILSALRERGHAYAEVLRNYSVDVSARRATASLTAVPGPRVIVDSIVLVGGANLGREAVLRQLTFEQGDVLRASDLVESQRNLYGLELVQFASVSVAQDTVAPEPVVPGIVAPVSPGTGLPAAPADDSARATVVVSIAEAPVHLVEARVGYASVECFRVQTRWVSRSFGGGARRLELSGSVSKIGIGAPLDLGLGGSLCSSFEGDPFRDDLDYRLSADFSQPYFQGPRNRLTLNAFAERQSEPGVFQRVAQGGRIAIVRRLGRLGTRSFLTVAFDAERTRTRSTPVLFCIAFLVCRPSDVEQLSRARRQHSLGVSWLTDETDTPIDPRAGYRLQTGTAWAADWLGSEVEFVRWTGDGSVYRTVAPEWVLAGRLRLGSFLGTVGIEPDGPDGEDFLPPEDRFFAGGASTVRGYARNALGPGVYVADSATVDPLTGFPEPIGRIRFVPTGGTSVAVANAELRFPGPFARENLRLAVFLDAGAVGTDQLWDLGTWRFTPGVGLRIGTVIGPIRVDIAYNPYGPTVGPLFVPAEETGELVRIDPAFSPEEGSFLDRFRVHLAVGQPF